MNLRHVVQYTDDVLRICKENPRGLSVPNKPGGFCGRKATLKQTVVWLGRLWGVVHGLHRDYTVAEGELREGDYETDVSDEEDEDERAEDANKVDDGVN